MEQYGYDSIILTVGTRTLINPGSTNVWDIMENLCCYLGQYGYDSILKVGWYPFVWGILEYFCWLEQYV